MSEQSMTITYLAPPREASPDRLLEVCETLGEGQLTKHEVVETANGGTDAIYDTIRYGEQLGFLMTSSEGVATTFLGRAATEAHEEGQRAESFRTGLAYYTLYVDLLATCMDIDSPPERIARSTVAETLEAEFGLDVSKKTMKERVHTFMRTLEWCDLGDFEPGRKSRETGFRLKPGIGRALREIISVSALDLVQESERSIVAGPASGQGTKSEWDLSSGTGVQTRLSDQDVADDDDDEMERLF